jgi:hypothetical protein
VDFHDVSVTSYWWKWYDAFLDALLKKWKWDRPFGQATISQCSDFSGAVLSSTYTYCFFLVIIEMFTLIRRSVVNICDGRILWHVGTLFSILPIIFHIFYTMMYLFRGSACIGMFIVQWRESYGELSRDYNVFTIWSIFFNLKSFCVEMNTI